MRGYAFGSVAGKVMRAAVVPFWLVLSTASQGGCAENTGAYAANPADVAVNTQPSSYVEMEADGLPVQPPPLQRARAVEDDPSEPFSRNYGGPNPAAIAPPVTNRASATPDIPADIPPDVRRRLADASRSNAY